MSEQLITPPSADDTAHSADIEGWHQVAGEYKAWHPGLHPYVESQLATRGISHAAEARETDSEVSNTEQLLGDIIRITDDPAVRRALRAERRHESTLELEAILDTIVGIKLNALAADDEATFAHAEQLLTESYRGNEIAARKVAHGLRRAHDHASLTTPSKEPLHLDIELEKYRKDLLDRGWHEELIGSKLQVFVKEWEKEHRREQLGYEHLSIVHATNYLPRRHEADELLHIGSQFDATGLPRNTVHVALNHMVESNPMSSDWSGRHFIIVAPMDKVAQLNGDPSSMVAHDTWWETRPNAGLVLPEDTIIVRPGATVLVSIDPAGKEVRYKSHAIDEVDIEALGELAGGYELLLIANKLGVKLESQTETLKHLEDTDLKQHTTELDLGERKKVVEALQALLTADRQTAEVLFADTVKRTAVRKALELQGREVIEPHTVMSGGEFASEAISDDLRKLRRGKRVSGSHHSNTVVYGLEKRATQLLLEPSGSSEEERRTLSEQIKQHADELSVATLQMYYRLGLF